MFKRAIEVLRKHVGADVYASAHAVAYAVVMAVLLASCVGAFKDRSFTEAALYLVVLIIGSTALILRNWHDI